MTSLRKRFANARNAQRCTGPKTAAGKSRAARNAFQHGLNLPVLADAALAPELEDLARKIAGEGASPRLRELAERIAEAQVDVMRARRAKHPELPPLRFGVAGYAIVRQSDADVKKEVARITDVRASARGYASYLDFIKGSQLETQVSLEDYSVSNRGLRTGLVGTSDQVAERIRELERIGIDLLLLQCSPQREEMDRIAQEVFPLVRA